MKNKILLLLPFLCLFLSSCFELEETYNLKDDGAYEVNYGIDLSKLMGIAAMLNPDSAASMAKSMLVKDTLINLGATANNANENLTDQERNLLDRTVVRTQMDMPNGLFKISFNSKGNSIEELKYFLSNFSSTIKKRKTVEMIMSPPPGAKISKGKSTESPYQDKESDLPFKNEEYDFVITSNSFERKVRPELIAAQKEKNEKAFKVLKMMDMKMTSKIIINLPRAAISVDNEKATLSPDRKQFKLEIDMIEAMLHPEMLNFKVNY